MFSLPLPPSFQAASTLRILDEAFSMVTLVSRSEPNFSETYYIGGQPRVSFSPLANIDLPDGDPL